MVKYTRDIVGKYELSTASANKLSYLSPNQYLVKNVISPVTIYDSILLYWTVGTGKTCGAISISEGFKDYLLRLESKVIVLVKNQNIEKNFRDQLLSNCTNEEYVSNDDRRMLFSRVDPERAKDISNSVRKKINSLYQFVSYGTFTNNNKISPKDNFSNCVVIIDEVHNIINNDTYIAVMNVLQNSYNTRLVLLTATPVFNDVSEIAEISNLLNFNNQSRLLPIRNDLVNAGYVTKQEYAFIPNPTFLDSLRTTLQGKISYLDSDKQDFPEVLDQGELVRSDTNVNVVFCEMGQYQLDLYKIAIDQDTRPGSVEARTGLYQMSSMASTIVFPGNTFKKETLEEITDKSSIFKKENIQVYSCKLASLLQNLQEKAFIYSNYIKNAGTELVKYLLLENGWSEYGVGKRGVKGTFVLYNNSTPIETRENLRKLFNSKENTYGEIIQILVGSPAISEGINLKSVKEVHILEPAWNMSRIEQIVGRAVRKHSHSFLPPHLRNVKIFKYVAHKSYNSFTYFIDKEKYILSYQKDKAASVVYDLLKDVSLENTQVNNPEDYSTYTLNLGIFERDIISVVTKKLRQMFSEWHTYSLESILEVIDVKKQIVEYVIKKMVTEKTPITSSTSKEGVLAICNGKYVTLETDTDHFDFTVKKSSLTLASKAVDTKEKKEVKPIVELDVSKLQNGIYGTYKNRLGEYDGKFRIIDIRGEASSDVASDKRKTVTGVAATSLEKTKLISILQFFRLKFTQIQNSRELIKLIETYMTSSNLIV